MGEKEIWRRRKQASFDQNCTSDDFKGYFQVLINCPHKSQGFWRFKSIQKDIAYTANECQSSRAVGFADGMLINYSEFNILKYNVTLCSQEILFYFILFFSVYGCVFHPTQLCSMQKTTTINQLSKELKWQSKYLQTPLFLKDFLV